MDSIDHLPDSMFGLQATFYKDRQPIFNADNLTELQDFYTVSHIDLDWGDRSPGPDIPSDNFSAVFEGQLIANQTGDHTLYLTTGDSEEEVRLYVDGELLLDTWDVPPPNVIHTTEHQIPLSLIEGQAKDIRLEYREGHGRAKLKLEWDADGLERQVIPKQNFIRHPYGDVDESDLLILQVATNGGDVEVISEPTEDDYLSISQQIFSSIQDAVEQAEVLLNQGQGVKILIEPGDYRVSDYGNYGIVLGNGEARDPEDLALNEQGWLTPLVIEGAAPGVRILGSQQWQEGWNHLGNGVYVHEWRENWGFEAPETNRPPTDPITHRREAVFVNGDRLEPILIRPGVYDRDSQQYVLEPKIDPVQTLEEGQFTIDEGRNALYIRLPEGATIDDTIEVAQAQQLLRVREPKSNLVLRNLEFAYGANRYSQNYAFAAVDIGGSRRLAELGHPQNIILDDISVHNNSGAGLRVRNVEKVTVQDSSFNHNGALGISTAHLDGVLFHNVDAQYNNWRGDLGGYRGWFVAGIKNLRGENFTADTVNTSHNYTHGYWHDENAKHTVLINSTAENNSRHGFFLEVSDGPHQVIDSQSLGNGGTGIMINTSPNVFLQGNRVANNGDGRGVNGEELKPGTDAGDGEIRIGARIDREADHPELPDIADNLTLIDNIIQNTSDRTNNELIAIYGDPDRYQDLLQHELEANHNVYWDITGEPIFDLRYNRKIAFSDVNWRGESWLGVSERDRFEAGSVFEEPQSGQSPPQYTGSFEATLKQEESIVLTLDQLGVDDPDTYASNLTYTLNRSPEQGALRLRGVRLNPGESFRLSDVARGWISYTHEGPNAVPIEEADNDAFMPTEDSDDSTASDNTGLASVPIGDSDDPIAALTGDSDEPTTASIEESDGSMSVVVEDSDNSIPIGDSNKSIAALTEDSDEPTSASTQDSDGSISVVVEDSNNSAAVLTGDNDEPTSVSTQDDGELTSATTRDAVAIEESNDSVVVPTEDGDDPTTVPIQDSGDSVFMFIEDSDNPAPIQDDDGSMSVPIEDSDDSAVITTQDILFLEVSDGDHQLTEQPFSFTIEAVIPSEDIPSEDIPSEDIPSIDAPEVLSPLDPDTIMDPITASPSGLVVHLRLDESDGIIAEDSAPEGINNSGHLVGNAQWAPGLNQGAILLNGNNDAIHLSDSEDINLGLHEQRTVSLWVKTDALPSGDAPKQVIYEEGSRRRGLNIYLEDELLYLGGWNMLPGESNWDGTWLSTDAFLVGQWNHIALVLGGGDSPTDTPLQGYLNGEMFAEGEGALLWEHGGGIGIGNTNGATQFHDGQAGSGQGLIGAIDEVQVFNTALTDVQVQVLMLMPM